MSRELAEDDLGLTGALQGRIDRLEPEIRQRARPGPRVKVLAPLPGIGPFTALVILAKAGDISRFASARKLASWAGLTPTVRGSDRGRLLRAHLEKKGRCGCAGCCVRRPRRAAPGVRRHFPAHRATAREKIAATAIARKLITRAWRLLTGAGHAAAPQPAAPQTAAQ